MEIPPKYQQAIVVHISENDFNVTVCTPVWLFNTRLTDRGTSRLSFIMPGAVLVQIGYHSMEIIDNIDNLTYKLATNVDIIIPHRQDRH
jgi:hypothetical protein